jgi:hypothetical protein
MYMSRDGWISIVTKLRAGRPVFDSRQGEEISLRYSVQIGSGAHPVSFPTGTMGPSPGIKRLGREADNSPPSSTEVKNA